MYQAPSPLRNQNDQFLIGDSAGFLDLNPVSLSLMPLTLFRPSELLIHAVKQKPENSAHWRYIPIQSLCSFKGKNKAVQARLIPVN